jgi:hypothetical protein
MTWTDHSSPARKCIIRPITLNIEYFVTLRRLILLWEWHSLKVQTSIAEVALLEIDVDAAHFEWLAIAGVSIDNLGCAVRLPYFLDIENQIGSPVVFSPRKLVIYDIVRDVVC